MTFKKILSYAAYVLTLIASMSLLMWYIYSQQYVQDSETTASKGIGFSNTLHLNKYSKVASGNGWLGRYDRYSRSDRHTEVLTVYCKSFCKKK